MSTGTSGALTDWPGCDWCTTHTALWKCSRIQSTLQWEIQSTVLSTDQCIEHMVEQSRVKDKSIVYLTCYCIG